MEPSSDLLDYAILLNNSLRTFSDLLRQYQELENDIILLTGYGLGQLKALFAKGYTLQSPIETVEIDGQTLIVDRESNEQSPKVLKLDWENVNIDKELEWLKGEQK